MELISPVYWVSQKSAIFGDFSDFKTHFPCNRRALGCSLWHNNLWLLVCPNIILFKRDLFLFKGPFPGKWHVFVLALLYLFEYLNE